ncbi:MAG: 4Fe-4S dicluster domain-containing protein [Elusimicrobia bacterium]|nr:4Fe-4S dicluster domain-containing protein [Elusimicrobiota bacterium]
MSLYYITNSNWTHFLQTLLRQFNTYAPIKQSPEISFWQRITTENLSQIVLDSYRVLHPTKGFFSPVKEEVTTEPQTKKTIILGLKGCDLGHIKTLDAMFLGGKIKDPYYENKRKNTILISSDCEEYAPSCFCTSMEGKPYPTEGFDMNLTSLRGGFLVQAGSLVCENLILDRKRLFQDPQPYHLKEREDIRNRMTQSVMQNNKDFTWDNPRSIVQNNFDSQQWKAFVAPTCVECDACRFICGTCYCFIMAESKKKWERTRTWDSCQSAGYGRVAGGANPRKTRFERLRNFYICKLFYRPENFNFYACTGCGRCIDVCQGKIDIRKSLQKIIMEP